VDLCPQFWKMALLAQPNQTPWLQVNEATYETRSLDET
jgi:hypothetical protein